jgi:trk system potassium uptake protein TrkA
MIDKSLEELNDDLSKYEYRAVAITRDGNTIIPHGDDKLKDNDLVYVITNKKDVEELMKFSGKEMFDIRDIMILGGSRIGKTTAKELGGHHSIKLIELDRAKSYRLSNFLNNALVINGDGRDMNLLMEEGLAKMDAFVAVTGNSETNILSCIFAKRMGVKKTIAEVENMDYITLAENMGIDAIINKKVITASRIFRFTKSEEVASITCLSGTEAEVMEFVAQPDSRITKGPLSDIGFPKTSIVGGVIRANTSFIANGDTVIKPYDKVVVFTLPASMSKLGKFFN